MPSLQAVESSNVKAVGFDPATGTLFVQFKSSPGSVYAYPDCTQADFDALVGAESVGKYFNQRIKGRDFRKESLSDD